MAIDKYESRRIRAEIRQVLLRSWDPIGIRDEPNAQNEYDSYLGGIYELLVRRATEQEIAAHLFNIVKDRMEIDASAGDIAKTVRALNAIEIRK